MIYYLGLLLSGSLQAIMIALNGKLGEHFGSFGVTFFVHAIALVLLLAYLAVRREKIRFLGAPWYVYLVGAFGIGIVATSSMCTVQIGAATVMAISTAGQLISSELIDHFGLFGMPRVRFSFRQLPAFALVVTGVALVVLN